MTDGKAPLQSTACEYQIRHLHLFEKVSAANHPVLCRKCVTLQVVQRLPYRGSRTHRARTVCAPYIFFI